MTPFLTIVMPVRNEARFIRDTLLQLLAQDFPTDSYEIIVADGMSDDGTREIVTELAQSYPQIRLLDNPKRLSSAGRNVGFKEGRGDYFLVVDGHCYIPDTKLFSNTIECFLKSGADCLGRPQPLDPPSLTPFQKSVALARASRLGHGGDSLIYGDYEGFASPVSNGAAYARHVFEKVGYVDENFDAAEDVEFNYRVEKAGLTCFTSPKLTVRYYPRENLRGLFRQMMRYGKGRRRFTWKHPKAQTINQLIPVVFTSGLYCLICSPAMYLFAGVLFPLKFMSFLYSFYLVLIVGDTFRIMIKKGVYYGKTYPLVLIVIHYALGYGFLRETMWIFYRSFKAILNKSENSRLPL